MLSPRVNTGWERGRDAGPLTRLDEARAERTESGRRRTRTRGSRATTAMDGAVTSGRDSTGTVT